MLVRRADLYLREREIQTFIFSTAAAVNSTFIHESCRPKYNFCPEYLWYNLLPISLLCLYVYETRISGSLQYVQLPMLIFTDCKLPVWLQVVVICVLFWGSVFMVFATADVHVYSIVQLPLCIFTICTTASASLQSVQLPLCNFTVFTTACVHIYSLVQLPVSIFTLLYNCLCASLQSVQLSLCIFTFCTTASVHFTVL